MIYEDKLLLDKLFKKLKQKPVYKTINKLDSTKDPIITLKGLYSLCTHLVIEINRGGVEYIPLLEALHITTTKVLKEIKLGSDF